MKPVLLLLLTINYAGGAFAQHWNMSFGMHSTIHKFNNTRDLIYSSTFSKIGYELGFGYKRDKFGLQINTGNTRQQLNNLPNMKNPPQGFLEWSKMDVVYLAGGLEGYFQMFAQHKIKINTLAGLSVQRFNQSLQNYKLIGGSEHIAEKGTDSTTGRNAIFFKQGFAACLQFGEANIGLECATFLKFRDFYAVYNDYNFLKNNSLFYVHFKLFCRYGFGFKKK